MGVAAAAPARVEPRGLLGTGDGQLCAVHLVGDRARLAHPVVGRVPRPRLQDPGAEPGGEAGHPLGQLADRRARGLQVQRRCHEHAHRDADQRPEHGLLDAGDPERTGAADLEQQHRADRRLEQVRAEPQHLADHDRAGDDGAEAPPGQADEVGHQHGDRHPGEHAADAAQAVDQALVQGQLDDEQRHQGRDDRVLGQVQDLGEQVGGDHGERHLGGAQAGRAAAAEERGTDAVGAGAGQAGHEKTSGRRTVSSRTSSSGGRASGPSRVDSPLPRLTIPITESCQRPAL